MAKVRRATPFMATRVTYPVRTKVFTDENQPEWELNIGMRKPDAPTAAMGIELAQAKIKQFITGDKATNKPPSDFVPVGGIPIQMTEAFCYQVSAIVIMQVQVEADLPPYTFDEMVGISVTGPIIWKELNAFAEEVNSEGEKKLEKVALTPLSGSVFGSVLPITPSSWTGQTGSGTASTTELKTSAPLLPISDPSSPEVVLPGIPEDVLRSLAMQIDQSDSNTTTSEMHGSTTS